MSRDPDGSLLQGDIEEGDAIGEDASVMSLGSDSDDVPPGSDVDDPSIVSPGSDVDDPENLQSLPSEATARIPVDPEGLVISEIVTEGEEEIRGEPIQDDHVENPIWWEEDNLDEENFPLHFACATLKPLQALQNLVGNGHDVLLQDGGGRYPLHWACKFGAGIEIVQYLVEHANGDHGKEAIYKKDFYGQYPLHLAATFGDYSVVRYLIEQESGEHEDSPLILQADTSGMFPLHCACEGRASMQTIRFLIEGIDKGRKPLQIPNGRGQYPVHIACELDPRDDIIEYLVRNSVDALFIRDNDDNLPFDYMSDSQRRAFFSIFSTHQTAGVDDKPSKVDRLGYRIYAEALAHTAMQAELPNSSLCVGLYARWGGGKSTLWNLIEECLRAEFLQSDVACLSRAVGYGHDTDKSKEQLLNSEEKDALSAFGASIEALGKHPGVPKTIKDAWKEAYKPPESTPNFLEEFISEFQSSYEVFRATSSQSKFKAMWDFSLRQGIAFRSYFDRRKNKPIGATDYQVVTFKAWEYQGSDLIWASLIEQIWEAVETRYGKSIVNLHRASIALAGETPYSRQNSSTEERAQNRKRALRMFYLRLIVFFFLLFFTVLAIFIIMYHVPKKSNPTQSSITNTTGTGDNPMQSSITNTTGSGDNPTESSGSSTSGSRDPNLIRSIVLIVAASIPILKEVVTFFRTVWPYLRSTRGLYIFNEAANASQRVDMKEKLGFMGEVKTEVEYLFDLLTTEVFYDEDIGCNRHLRLCIFIDDLDRCPAEIVVRVLEAVILLLVDGPISVWMAIDSRIVIQCIEAVKGDIFDKANVSGHEFLDKIVQLPFSLPRLSNGAKSAYLEKVIQSRDLEPDRVLSRWRQIMQDIRKRHVKQNGLHPGSVVEALNGIGDRTTSDDTALDKLVEIARTMYNEHAIEESAQRKSESGMSDKELIDLIDKERENANAEQIEIFSTMILSNMSRIQSVLDDGGRPDEQYFHNDPDTPLDIASYLKLLRDEYDMYVPMLDERERESLSTCVPFIDGNPRKMKRIINVFNVSRHIVESRVGKSNQNLQAFTPKLLKFIILLEQWPFRMAWVLQLIEDVEQICRHEIHEGIQVRIMENLRESFPEEFLDEEDARCWEVLCGISVKDLYERFIHGMIMKSSKAVGLSLIDSDPKLFSGLLRDEMYEISVEELSSPSFYDPFLLRNYAFNMPHDVTDKVSALLATMLSEDQTEEPNA